MNRIEFTKMLEIIGWRLEGRGCGHFSIVNHKNESTDFEYIDGEEPKIEIRNDKAFGKKAGKYGGAGVMVFVLNICEVTEIKSNNKDTDAIAVSTKDESSYIMFMNHD